MEYKPAPKPSEQWCSAARASAPERFFDQFGRPLGDVRRASLYDSMGRPFDDALRDDVRCGWWMLGEFWSDQYAAAHGWSTRGVLARRREAEREATFGPFDIYGRPRKPPPPPESPPPRLWPPPYDWAPRDEIFEAFGDCWVSFVEAVEDFWDALFPFSDVPTHDEGAR